MQGFWPTCTNLKEQFSYVVSAIKLRDDGFIIQTINNHPELLTFTDVQGNTLFHHAAIEGCSTKIFDFFLSRTSNVELQNLQGLTVYHYLLQFNRTNFIDTFVAKFPNVGNAPYSLDNPSLTQEDEPKITKKVSNKFK